VQKATRLRDLLTEFCAALELAYAEVASPPVVTRRRPAPLITTRRENAFACARGELRCEYGWVVERIKVCLNGGGVGLSIRLCR
jgi:hypothetical protein